MKNAWHPIIWIIFILIIAGYAGGFYLYSEYRGKAVSLDKHARLTMSRFDGIEKELRDIYANLASTAEENKGEKKELLYRINNMRESIRDWREGYNSTVSELKGSIEDLKVGRLRLMVENLQDDIEKFKMAIQDLNLKFDASGNMAADSENNKGASESVDLGRIAVKKDLNSKDPKKPENNHVLPRGIKPGGIK